MLLIFMLDIVCSMCREEIFFPEQGMCIQLDALNFLLLTFTPSFLLPHKIALLASTAPRQVYHDN